MRAALLLLPVLLAGCDRSASDRIDKYEGRWVSPPFAEMVADAAEEMVEELRGGQAGAFLDGLSEKERAEFLAMSDEELRQMVISSSKRTAAIADIRFVAEISLPDSLTISMLANGEKLGELKEAGDFEVTEREILFRTDEETRVIYIGDGCLRVRNEDHGKYPRFITLFRDKGKAGS